GGEPTIALTNLPALRSVGANLGGNDSACLSRVLGGAFASNNGVVVACGTPQSCILTLVLDKPANDTASAGLLVDAEAKRFRQFFRLPDNQFFQTRAAGGVARIFCNADSCSFAIAQDAKSMPALPANNRINP